MQNRLTQVVLVAGCLAALAGGVRVSAASQQAAGQAAAKPAEQASSAKPAEPPPPLPPPSLAGRWELNTGASDPIQTEPREPGEEGGGRRSGGGMGGRGGSRGGGMGGRGGAGEGGEGRAAERDTDAALEEMRRVMEPLRVLVIVQHESAISVTDDQGRVVTLKPNGEKLKEVQAGASIERTTRWDGRSLVTQTKLVNGVRVTQTFTKVNEGLVLIVATKLEGGRFRKGLEFKRVYDQALQ